MSDELPITFSHGTDVGRVRDHNEDWVAVYDPPTPEAKHKGQLFVIADGMGGYLAGEVASRMAVETIQREYYADPSDDPATRLQNAVQTANAAVFDSAHSERAHSGMGTTIVATALIGRKAYIAAVGDSRAYIIHQGKLIQITQDHSFVGEQIRAGLLTKEQARLHPQRNVITRALGSQPTVQVDLFVGELSEGDVLIMCSDGLTGHVPEDRLQDVALELPPEQAIKKLIQMANENGGSDNISVIVLRAGAQTPSPQATPSASSASASLPRQPTSSGLKPIWIGVGAAITLLGVITVGALILGLGGFIVWETKFKATPTTAPTLPASLPTVTPLPPVLTPTVAPPTLEPTSTSIPTLTPTLTPEPGLLPTPGNTLIPTPTVTQP